MKAKDLRGKNIEDVEEGADEPKQEDDAVAAAYENISKKLDNIRSGKNTDDSDDEDQSRKDAEEERGTTQEPELEEWKGPKPFRKESKVSDESEDEHDLRKVKLTNLEDAEESKGSKESDESKDEEIDPLDDEDEDEEEEKHAKKEWEPKEGDPLDEEEEVTKETEATKVTKDDELEEKEGVEGLDKGDMNEESDEPKESEEEEHEHESLHSEVRRPEVSEPEDLPEDVDRSPKGPDTLDDLAEDSPFGRHETQSSKMDEAEEELPYHRNTSEEQDEDYSIPHIKGSRQNSAEMGYNAHPQRESVGQSYSPRGSMDGNDPNNFFSQHQPQAPKRANKFHLLILIVIGVAVIGFTVYILKGGFGGINLGTSAPSPSPSATATPEPTPTPTPEPEVERGNFTVKVLNGTSTSGLAKTVSDKLKEAGFKTAAPGNAPDDDVEQTEIRVKEGTESATLFERLKLDLAPDYEATQGDNLDEKVTYDAEVIIGAK